MTTCYHTLPSGLRMVARHCPDWAVECMGVAVDAGSRDDLHGHEGIAHFVEHTIFKGTPRRRASYVLNRMEAVGGELNAYTTKESTMVYALAPAGNLKRGASLIAELIQESSFPKAEIDKERTVVAEEIDSYLDTPSDAVVDDFEELLFSHHAPLSHNILGTKQSLETLTTGVCRQFLDSLYTPHNMVFFYSGPEKPDKVFTLASRLFTSLDSRKLSRVKTTPVWQECPTFNEVRDLGLHQAHTVAGTMLPGLSDPRRTALTLLSNVIGGPGMNSLLNVALREKRGMVYSVDASVGMMSDVGIFSVYFGCDPDDVDRCKALATNILTRVAEEGLTPRALASAKRQGTGQLILASQNPENSTLAMARATLYHGTAHTLEQTVERINQLTTGQVAEAAELLHPSRFTTLTLL